MDLRLADEDPSNTVILLPDDTSLYYVETPFKWISYSPTIVKKSVQGQITEMARVKIHLGLGAASSAVHVWGHDVTPQRSGLLSSSETFVASNGQSYKWKAEIGSELYCVASDPEGGCVATYDAGSLGFFGKARLPTLTVTPQGMPIGDDLVATFIYMKIKEIRRKRRRRNNH